MVPATDLTIISKKGYTHMTTGKVLEADNNQMTAGNRLTVVTDNVKHNLSCLSFSDTRPMARMGYYAPQNHIIITTINQVSY